MDNNKITYCLDFGGHKEYIHYDAERQMAKVNTEQEERYMSHDKLMDFLFSAQVLGWKFEKL